MKNKQTKITRKLEEGENTPENQQNVIWKLVGEKVTENERKHMFKNYKKTGFIRIIMIYLHVKSVMPDQKSCY